MQKILTPSVHFSIMIVISVIAAGILLLSLLAVNQYYSISGVKNYVLFIFAMWAPASISVFMGKRFFHAGCDTCGEKMTYTALGKVRYSCNQCTAYVDMEKLTQDTDSHILENSSVKLDVFEDFELIHIGEKGHTYVYSRAITFAVALLLVAIGAYLFDLKETLNTIQSLWYQRNYFLVYVYVGFITILLLMFSLLVKRQLREPLPEQYHLHKNHLIYKTGLPTAKRVMNQYRKSENSDERPFQHMMFSFNESYNIPIDELNSIENIIFGDEYGLFIKQQDDEILNLSCYATEEEREWLMSYICKHYSIKPSKPE